LRRWILSDQAFPIFRRQQRQQYLLFSAWLYQIGNNLFAPIILRKSVQFQRCTPSSPAELQKEIEVPGIEAIYVQICVILATVSSERL
jgi:hypothetical protein